MLADVFGVTSRPAGQHTPQAQAQAQPRPQASLQGPFDVAYAYSPRESTQSGGKVHLVCRAPLRVGRIVREAGDALCKPRRQFWGLDGGRTMEDFERYGCARCKTIRAKLPEGSRARVPAAQRKRLQAEALVALRPVEAEMEEAERARKQRQDRLARQVGVEPWRGAEHEPYLAWKRRFADAIREADEAGRIASQVWTEGAALERRCSELFGRRWDLRTAVGLDPRTGKPPERERPRNAVGHVGSGHYPLLLDDTAELRSNCPEPEIVHDDGTIRHAVCVDGAWHHLRYFVGGEAVSGLTLRAGRPWRGQQKAVIDTVYTDPAHRGSGYARELLDYARGYFREVRHSSDLTEDGSQWKAAVQRDRRGRR